MNQKNQFPGLWVKNEKHRGTVTSQVFNRACLTTNIRRLVLWGPQCLKTTSATRNLNQISEEPFLVGVFAVRQEPAVADAFGVDPMALNALTYGLTARRVLASESAAFDQAAADPWEQYKPATSRTF